MGAPDAEPLLGVTALESVGIEVDPLNRRLRRRPAVRLKGVRALRAGRAANAGNAEGNGSNDSSP